MTLNQHKVENYVIIASLKSEAIGKLIKIEYQVRIFDIKLTRLDKAMPGNLDTKRHSPGTLYVNRYNGNTKIIDHGLFKANKIMPYT